jgi:hypothetical protein
MATAGVPSGNILAARPVFILFYLLVIKDNDPAVKI